MFYLRQASGSTRGISTWISAVCVQSTYSVFAALVFLSAVPLSTFRKLRITIAYKALRFLQYRRPPTPLARLAHHRGLPPDGEFAPVLHFFVDAVSTQDGRGGPSMGNVGGRVASRESAVY